MPVGNRREARERALSLLYEADAKGIGVGALVEEQPLPPERFVVDLVRGVEAERERIDALVERHAIGWSIERMPVVDRTLLRMAVHELLETDVPTGAVISEAVELAKTYSTDESGRFVNGVLGAVAAEVRPKPAPVD